MDMFDDAVKVAVFKRVRQAMEEEIEVATRKLREKLVHETDHLALSVLKLYDVEHLKDRIVITVKKEI